MADQTVRDRLVSRVVVNTHSHMNSNRGARAFWEHPGWFRRDALTRYSFITSGDSNA